MPSGAQWGVNLKKKRGNTSQPVSCKNAGQDTHAALRPEGCALLPPRRRRQPLTARWQIPRAGACLLPLEFSAASADSRFFLLQLGTYNPIANPAGIKEVRLNTDRIKYWLSVGAQPSDRVAWLLGKADVLPMPPRRHRPTISQARKDRTAAFSTWAAEIDTDYTMPSIAALLGHHSKE